METKRYRKARDFTMTVEQQAMLKELSEFYGSSQAEVVRTALRLLYVNTKMGTRLVKDGQVPR